MPPSKVGVCAVVKELGASVEWPNGIIGVEWPNGARSACEYDGCAGRGGGGGGGGGVV